MEKLKRELSQAQLDQRGTAAVTHGAHSDTTLAPAITAMRKTLLTRMGLRQRDLTWAAFELLDSYCRAKAKVAAIDAWLESNALIDKDGNTAGPLKLYFVALNSSTRTLEALRGLMAEQARNDARFDDALTALAAEGARARANRSDHHG